MWTEDLARFNGFLLYAGDLSLSTSFQRAFNFINLKAKTPNFFSRTFSSFFTILFLSLLI